MRRLLPPLNALRSLDAAARHQSFTCAAEELCLTQGAVSHQVKALEIELALQLFKREHNGLVITEAGRGYLARGARRVRAARAGHRSAAAAAAFGHDHGQHVTRFGR